MVWSNCAICERKDRDSLSILEGRSILGVKIILSEIPLFNDILFLGRIIFKTISIYW